MMNNETGPIKMFIVSMTNGDKMTFTGEEAVTAHNRIEHMTLDYPVAFDLRNGKYIYTLVSTYISNTTRYNWEV